MSSFAFTALAQERGFKSLVLHYASSSLGDELDENAGHMGRLQVGFRLRNYHEPASPWLLNRGRTSQGPNCLKSELALKVWFLICKIVSRPIQTWQKVPLWSVRSLVLSFPRSSQCPSDTLSTWYSLEWFAFRFHFLTTRTVCSTHMRPPEAPESLLFSNVLSEFNICSILASPGFRYCSSFMFKKFAIQLLTSLIQNVLIQNRPGTLTPCGKLSTPSRPLSARCLTFDIMPSNSANWGTCHGWR